MWHDYRVTAAGHTHAGKPLAVGATVRLRASVAARHPNTFALVAAAPVPGRAPRRAATAHEAPAPAAPSTTED